MKKIFISMPMNGKTKDEILENRDVIIKLLESYFSDEITVIDSVLEPPENTTNCALWCLGRSMQLLAEADVAVFDEGWQTARGCWMEHEACIRYGIETLYVQLGETMTIKLYTIVGAVSALIGAFGTHLHYQSEIADYKLQAEQKYREQLELKIEETKKLHQTINEIEWELIEQKDSYEKNLADLRSKYTLSGVFDCSRNGECLPRTSGSTGEFVCYRKADLHRRIDGSMAIAKRADHLALRYNALLKVCNER